ncbi:MAG: hypothetical protein RIS35_3277, partial [Pseudomonadota bacterium]
MATATVLSITGNPTVVLVDGSIRALRAGDVILAGEKIVTGPGAGVELRMTDGQILSLGQNETVRIDDAMARSDSTPSAPEASVQPGTLNQVRDVLARGGDLTEELEAPAAGSTGGDGADGSTFVQLLRISEDVSGVSYDYGYAPLSGLAPPSPASVPVLGAPAVTHVGAGDPEIDDVTVPEGVTAVFTVNVGPVPTEPATFALVLANGTGPAAATLGSDFTDALVFSDGVAYDSGTGQITVPAGVGSFTVSVPTIDDALDEISPENFTLTVGGVTGTGLILDDEGTEITHVGAIDPAVDSVTVPEGVTAVFTVNVGPAPGQPTSFGLTLASGVGPAAAKLGADFTSALVFSDGVTYDSGTGQITVPAGVGSFTVSVPTIDDTLDEFSPENFTLTVGGVTGIGYITDDDVPTIRIVERARADDGTSDITVPEGTDAGFAVILTGVAEGGTLTLDLAPSGANPATEGVDYKVTTFQYSLDAGTSWQNATDGAPFAVNAGDGVVFVKIDTFNDTVDEPNETFTLTATLSSSGSDYAATGVATITDDDVPVITHVGAGDPAIDSVTVPEGTAAVFTVDVGPAPAQATDFALDLTGGTATLGADFTSALVFSNGVTYDSGTGKITVPAGVGSFTVSVPTIDDSVDEVSPEDFTLTVGGVSGTGFITDNDVPTIQVGDPTGADGNTNDITVPEGTDAVFAVKLTGVAAGGTLTLGLAPSGTVAATEGTDYKVATFQYSLDGGTTWQNATEGAPFAVNTGDGTVLVKTDTFNDTVDEPNETFTLTATL